MYCLVDFRNRPQLQYTFHSRQSAREYIRKIKNNPLGVTVLYRDGRREYFEDGLPKDLLSPDKRIVGIKKGCHSRYSLCKLNSVDGLLSEQGKKKPTSAPDNWRLKTSWPIFMLGNRKFYACLAIMVIFIFSSAYLFQKNYGSAAEMRIVPGEDGAVLGTSVRKTISADEETNGSLKLADDDIIFNLLGKIKEEKQGEFQTEILAYIKGKPMESMAPYIAKEPRMVAAFIVGIAMKESKFGIYAPHASDGRDCFNYWGYRGPENTTASGYSCFNSPEHAIQVVGKKINSLVAKGISNPAEMISWKCGSTCAGHGEENVRKWISDVGIYFSKINS